MKLVLLLQNFLSGFEFQLTHKSITKSLIHLHGFYLNKFRKASNGFLKSMKLAHVDKTKRLFPPGNLVSMTFGKLQKKVLDQGKIIIRTLLNDFEVLPSASDGSKSFADIFSENPDPDESNSQPKFLSRTNLRLLIL